MSFDKILFVRRDNIGDLLCTTPAIRAVREHFPQARIGVLTNTYIVDLIRGNPDVDDIHVFLKPKHFPERSKLAVFWENFRVYRQIRRIGYDAALACGLYNPTLARYTWFTGARLRIGYVREGKGRLFYQAALPEPRPLGHEVQNMFNLLSPLGITGEPGDLVLPVDPAAAAAFARFKAARLPGAKPLVAVSISARLSRNRWPLEKFMALIAAILDQGRADILLLWSPGSANPVTPGDDHLAARVQDCFGDAVLAYPTPTLPALVGAMAGAEVVVTLDTGTLHIAAALKKPTVALMTQDKAPVWRPWHTASRVLTAPEKVEDIAVEEVLPAVADFCSSFA